MKEPSETKQVVKPWKIVVGIVTLGLFAFMGFVIGDWIGLIIGIVIWFAGFAALTSSKLKSK